MGCPLVVEEKNDLLYIGLQKASNMPHRKEMRPGPISRMQAAPK